MSRGRWTIVEVDGRHLSAVRAEVRGGVVHVSHAVHAQAPADAGAGWAGAVLREAGMGGGRAVLAVPRAAVVFKVFPAPAAELSEGERLEMVSLQLARQLTFPPEQAAVDSMLVGSGRVVAAAMATSELDAARGALQAAGLRVVGTDLRSAGTAALAGPSESAGVIAPGRRTTEVVLAERGLPVFARAFDAEATMGDAGEHAPDRVAARAAVEFKRTLTSARGSGVEAELDRVRVIGDDDLAERVRAACELELGLSGDGPGAEVRWPEAVSLEDRRVLAPLAGVALRRAQGLDGVDFIRPHRAPDAAARRRQMALAAVFVVVTSVGLAALAGRSHLAALEQERDRKAAALEEAHDQWLRLRARDARIAHAQVWAGADEGWLDRAAWLTGSLPAARGVALDELSGKISAEATFEKGPEFVYPGRWAIERKATVHIEGNAGDRDRALALRRELLDSGRYHVLTLGPDAGQRFTFDLVALDKREVRAE